MPLKIENENGTVALVTYTDDSFSHDSSFYNYHVFLSFNDPKLNPPDENCWEAGSFECHYKSFNEDRVMEIANKFYQFLTAFRTSYGEEKTINEWRVKFEDEHKKVIADQWIIKQLDALISTQKSRIEELETDYVKKLETEIVALKSIIKYGHETALKAANILR